MRESDYTGSDLASWLEEAGRRRVVHTRSEPQVSPAAVPFPAAAPVASPRKSYVQHPRQLLLIALAAAAFMPYFFADVHVQIAGLPHLIVFV